MEVRVLERLSTFTPLGLRFWDAAFQRPVEDGLTAEAWPWEARDGRATRAVPTFSGALAFHGLPGLRAVEREGPEVDLGSPPTRRFLVEVRDAKRRYAPAAFAVELPLPYRGPFLGPGVASPGAAPGFQLLTGPDRPRPGALAAVRGELAWAATGAPVPWALVEVADPDGGLWRGLADAEGRFAVVLPWPALEEVTPGSPPVGPAGALAGRSWPITLSVRATAAGLPAIGPTGLPDYALLPVQPAEPVWPAPPDAAGAAPVPALALTLVHGETLIVRTPGSERSKLLVGAAPPSP